MKRGLLVGVRIKDRYELLKVVGAGGFSSVYLARDEQNNKVVAVKVLHEHLASEERIVRRFHKELEKATRLNHPGIVRYLDRGEEEGLHFLVMEYVEGRTLAHYLQERGKLPLIEALDLVRQTTEALSYAHRQGVIHRDLKPANLMVLEGGKIKVMDFGIAKDLWGTPSDSSQWFTPRYASPEQLLGNLPLDFRSDLYSLGVVLYEMLAGAPPFSQDTPVALYQTKRAEDYPPLTAACPELPGWVGKVVAKLLAADREDRYVSAEEVLVAMGGEGALKAKPGQLLCNRYHLLERIGYSGFSSVYRARDLNVNRLVAVKILHEHLASQERIVRCFHKELEKASRLEHPAIVRYLDQGEEGGLHFLVMEYLEGQTLAQYLQERGKLPLKEALSLTRQIAEALSYAHRQGAIHQDLKPANLMVLEGGKVKVMDFGIAGLRPDITDDDEGYNLYPRYVSPEQLLGKKGTEIDIRSDLYSLGVVLYEMLAGRTPFSQETPVGLYAAKKAEDYPPLTVICPELPGWVGKVVARLLAAEREDRYGSAKEVISSIDTETIGPADRPQSQRVEDALIGMVLKERYQIAEPSGYRESRGGFFPVYKAIDEKTGYSVEVVLDQWSKEQFLREAQRVAHYQHDGMESILDYGQQEGYRFFARELIAGVNLERYVLEQGPIPLPMALEVTSQIAEVLAYTHSNGLVHPALGIWDVIIRPDHPVEVTVKGFSTDGIGDIDNDEWMDDGPFFYNGTVAPAKIRTDPQSNNLFALGVILYEMLTGECPRSSRFEIIAWSELRQTLASSIHQDIPDWVENLIAKLLLVDPENKFKKAEDLVSMIDKENPSVPPSECIGLVLKRRYRIQRRSVSYYRDLEAFNLDRYDAQDTLSHTPVEIVVFEKRNVSPQDGAQFLLDAQKVKTCPHPAIERILDWGVTDRFWFQVRTKSTKGTSLAQLIEQAEPLPVSTVVAIVAQVAEALDMAHSKGLVHGVLYPDNLRLLPSGQIRIHGFSTMKSVKYFRDMDEGPTPIYRYYEPIVFNHEYLLEHHLEETYFSSRLDARQSDLYALGVILYQMLTKRLPHPEVRLDEARWWEALTKHDFVPPSLLRSGLPPWIDQVVYRLLAVRPADRYPSARDLLDDLPRRSVPQSVPKAKNMTHLKGKETRREERRNTLMLVFWILLGLVGVFCLMTPISFQGGSSVFFKVLLIAEILKYLLYAGILLFLIVRYRSNKFSFRKFLVMMLYWFLFLFVFELGVAIKSNTLAMLASLMILGFGVADLAGTNRGEI
ncbi:MAG: protein kinase [Deltaproteobacteria bacterium]